jgi:hypothetical protein
MKKYLIYASAAFFATTVLAIASPEVEMKPQSKEKAVWQAFKDKKSDDFKKLVAPDMMAVYADGIYNLQKEMGMMAKMDMKSFSLSDFTVVITDANTAIVTYKAKIEASVEGKDISGDYNAGSVWQMKKGEWHAVFHTDMKADAPASAAK